MSQAQHAVSSSGIIWASLAASAGVAALVTLAIEWLAKPGLEVRKDRIIEASRQRRAAVEQLRRVVYLCAKIGEVVGIQLMPELSQIEEPAKAHLDSQFRDRVVRHAQEAHPLFVESRYTIGKLLPPALKPDWPSITATVELFLARVQNEPTGRSALLEFDAAVRKLGAYTVLLESPRWRVQKRRKITRYLLNTPHRLEARPTVPRPDSSESVEESG